MMLRSLTFINFGVGSASVIPNIFTIKKKQGKEIGFCC